MKTEAIFTVPGVPPNWANERMHRMQLAQAYADWKWLVNRLAHGARNRAGWPRPIKTDPPAPRWVEFTQYRYTLLDGDGVWNSMKPLIDGLKGALVVDDSPTWCLVIARPHPLGEVQLPSPEAISLGLKSERARVVIRVRLMPPATVGCSDDGGMHGDGAESGQVVIDTHNTDAAPVPSPARSDQQGEARWKK